MVPLTYVSVNFVQEATEAKRIEDVVQEEVENTLNAELVELIVDREGELISMNMTLRTAQTLVLSGQHFPPGSDRGSLAGTSRTGDQQRDRLTAGSKSAPDPHSNLDDRTLPNPHAHGDAHAYCYRDRHSNAHQYCNSYTNQYANHEHSNTLSCSW